MGHRRENDSEWELAELGRAYAAALLAGDEVAAELVIRDALAAELSMSAIDDEIIAPALWLVGDLWERGDISIADEHLATEISLRVLALSREARRVSRARPDHRVMLAAPTAELHVVALRMTSDLLREAGYDVVMLGADVPPPALAVLGEPPPAARHLHELDDARRRRPAARRDARGAADLAQRGVRARRSRSHLAAALAARGRGMRAGHRRGRGRRCAWSSARP